MKAPVDSKDLKRELARLVAHRSVTRGPNRELIEDVKQQLEGLGLPCRLTWDDSETRANLFATFGPADRPGVVLSGHTDVVPVEGQSWSSDPFELVERDGKLFGRGTSDMKGFCAVPLAMASWIAEQPLKRPLHLAYSYDEEIGCVGVRRLLAELPEYAATPAACIVGEPTSMDVVTGHKGKRVLRCRVRGVAGHSSRPADGVNAIEGAAAVITRARAIAQRLVDEGPYGDRFGPPYSTMHTGVIHGGVAINIIPSDCVFELEIRNVPRHDPGPVLEELMAYARDTLEPAMKQVDPEAGFSWEEVVRYPSLDTALDADVVALARRLVDDAKTRAVGFGSEAGLFAEAGVPSVVCGPGSIEQAHRPDEFVAIDQLVRCQDMIERLVTELCEE